MKQNIINEETTKHNNANHVPFKKCFPNGWREYFRKEDVLLKIVEASGLTRTHDFVRVNTQYLVDDNRIALLVLLKRKDTEVLDKLIIDIISGYPQYEQIMDVLYNIGSDCDYHLVLYDENSKFADYNYDAVIGSMLTSLIDELRRSVFLTVMGIDLEMVKSNDVSFRCLNIESTSKDDGCKALPNRRKFDNAEFWTRYFIPAHRSYSIEIDEFDFDFNEYEEDGGDVMDSTAFWNDDGMTIKYITDVGNFRLLLINNAEDLDNFFKGWSVECKIAELGITVKEVKSIKDIISVLPGENSYPDAECQLTIHRHLPFRNFVYSLPEDKLSLAEKFAEYATAILSFECSLGLH